MRHPIRPYSGGEVVIVRDINTSLFSHVPFILFPVSDAFILALRMRKSKGALCRNPHEGLRMVFVNFAAVSRRLPNPLFAIRKLALFQSFRRHETGVFSRVRKNEPCVQTFTQGSSVSIRLFRSFVVQCFLSAVPGVLILFSRQTARRNRLLYLWPSCCLCQSLL